MRGLSFPGLVWRSLWARRIRFALTALGVAAPLATMITLGGLSESVRITFESGAEARHADLTVLQDHKIEPMTSRLPEGTVQALRSIPGVRSARGFLTDGLTLATGQGVVVFGWPEGYDELRLGAGVTPTRLQAGEVLVGWALAELGRLAVGDEIEINLRKFRVVGSYRSNSLAEDGGLYMRLEELQDITGAAGQISFVLVELAEGVAPGSIGRTIEAALPGVRALSTAQYVERNASLEMLRQFSRVAVFVSAILAVLVVSMIMVLAVHERTRELAILRAVGWSPTRIAWLIVCETLSVTVVGTACGLLLGRLGLNVAVTYLRDMGAFFHDVLSLRLQLQVVLTALVIALSASVLPAYHAIRLRVHEALKGE